MGSRLLKANACVRASGATNGRRKGGGGGSRVSKPKKGQNSGPFELLCVFRGADRGRGEPVAVLRELCMTCVAIPLSDGRTPQRV